MFANRSLRRMSIEELQHRIECLEGTGRLMPYEKAKLAAYYGELRKRGHKKFTVPSMVVPGRGRHKVGE